jgi:hypothetical protein
MGKWNLTVRRMDPSTAGFERDYVYSGIGSGVDVIEHLRPFPHVTVRLRTPGKERDEEGDRCHVAHLELLVHRIEVISYPAVVIYGYAHEVGFTDRPAVSEFFPEFYRYLPEPDPDWVPGIVEVFIRNA